MCQWSQALLKVFKEARSVLHELYLGFCVRNRFVVKLSTRQSLLSISFAGIDADDATILGKWDSL